MKIVCIIQARMGSTRFPGKVLADLNGQPVLAHVVERCRRVKQVDDVIVAAPSGNADLPIANWCLANGVKCYRPSIDQHDVQLRMLSIAQRIRADVIVRVCGDSPLVQPGEIDRAIAHLLVDGLDYVTGKYDEDFVIEHKRSCPEALTRRCLESLVDDRQHVTKHLRPSLDRCGTYPIFNLMPDTIDTPKDLERMAWRLAKPTLDRVLAETNTRRDL